MMQLKFLTSSPHASDAEDDGAGDPRPDLDAIDVLMGLSLSTKYVGI